MKSILILGGTSDIAIAVAEVYLAHNFKIVLAGRNPEKLQLVKNDLTIRFDGDISTKLFDAEKLQSHKEFVDTLDHLPDLTVCAFGYLGDQAMAKQDLEECLKILQVNFTGAVSILNVISERYKQQKRGTIVGISSVAGDRGRQSNFIYGSSKAAFSTYLSGLRNELFHFNCHVLTVKPGFVSTKMTAHLQLPPALTAKPAQVAKAVYRAVKRGSNTVYSLGIWRMIMMVIRLIPEGIFKRLKM